MIQSLSVLMLLTKDDPKPENDLVVYLSTKLISFIEIHRLTSIVLIVALFLLGIYGILMLGKLIFGIQKDRSGIQKELAETKKIELENLKSLYGLRDEHETAEAELNKLIGEFVGKFKSSATATELDTTRELLITHYCNKFLPTLEKYLDSYSVCKDSASCRRLITSTLLPQMESSNLFISTVNLQVILNVLGRNPLKLRRITFDSIWAFSEKHLRWHDFSVKSKMSKYENDLPE